ncbi:hypothetical protein WISP_67755 [Willisornis vidua]|uniref:Uncharacterized protein n=1 Tax=Willisornis vidua TaxID=1566151 RepID=A0ABQ9DE21_9PASS|nr:hypothetical protein WISP_67755 [Willisornis vidua]
MRHEADRKDLTTGEGSCTSVLRNGGGLNLRESQAVASNTQDSPLSDNFDNKNDDSDVEWAWMDPMIVVLPASASARERALAWYCIQTCCLHRASQPESGSRVWHTDHRPGDKLKHCAGNDV